MRTRSMFVVASLLLYPAIEAQWTTPRHDKKVNIIKQGGKIDPLVPGDPKSNENKINGAGAGGGAGAGVGNKLLSHNLLDFKHSRYRALVAKSQVYELVTTFEAVSGAFGNMFDIRALENIFIESMDFYTDLTTSVTYEVYTKKGSYIGSRQEPDDWTLTASGTTNGAGIGKGTLIPFDTFTPVPIQAGQLQGFYVTLTTPDIRYTPGNEVGTIVVSNSDLEVLEGSGVAEYPFGELFYAPRIWNGAVHYTVELTPAPSPSPTVSPLPTSYIPTSTRVSYSFMIERSSSDDVSEIASSADSSVEASVLSMFSDESKDLKALVDNHKLALVSVFSIVVDSKNREDCTITEIGNLCSVIKTSVSVTHDGSIASDEVKSTFLQYSSYLMDQLEFSSKTYVGATAVTAKTSFSLTTAEDPTEMGSDTASFFEETVLNFLNEGLSKGNPPTRISSVIIESQDASIPISRRLNSRLDVMTSITGEYMPPPDVNFGEVVEDSINDGSDMLISELNTNENLNIKGLEARVESTNQQPMVEQAPAKNETENVMAEPKKEDNFFTSPLFIILVIVGGIASCCGILFIYNLYLRSKLPSEQGYIVSKEDYYEQ